MLSTMEELIRKYGMLKAGDKVLCGVSGGADSICMLHGLYRLREKLGFELAAAHYNHNLRGAESDHDQAFVEQFVSLCCGQQRCSDGRLLPAVELYVGSGNVKEESKRRASGLEETAREMRYAFFRETAQNCGANRIAVAHTADDNVETVLLHLGRGSGLQGMGGIVPKRQDLIRPLLSTTRNQVEAYLQVQGLPHVEDHSNADVTFARNRIRHQVTPVLEELYPGFALRMVDTVRRLRQDEDCLSAIARERLSDAVPEDGMCRLPAARIAQAPNSIAIRMVRQLLSALNGGDERYTARHLESVVELCRSGDPSGQVNLPFGLMARREYDWLRILPREEQESISETRITKEGSYPAAGWVVNCSRVIWRGEESREYEFYLRDSDSLLMRARQTGDELRLPNRKNKSVKKWMVEEKIPRHLRDILPVLLIDQQVAAVTGLGVDESAQPQPGQNAWYIVIKPEEREE